jgi:predicted nucleotidyltransferase
MRNTRRVSRVREAKKIAGLLRQADPEKIILFGSAAKGRTWAGSDVDLCVIVDSYEGRPRFRLVQDFYKLLVAEHYDFPLDIDMHVYAVTDFEDRLARGDPFLREIADGKVLYERE